MYSPPTTEARAGGKRVLDVPFIEQHTNGFEAFEAKVRAVLGRDRDAPRA